MVKGSIKSILLLAIVGGICTSKAVFADNPVDFSITVKQTLSLVLSSNSVNIELTPTRDGTFGKTNFTVSSATNNAYGYILTMTNGTTYLESNTVDVNTNTRPRIQTLTQAVSESTFENATTAENGLNKWGIAINAGDYNAASTSAITIKETDSNNTTIDVTTVNVASKLDLEVPAGIYADTFNFQITAKVVDNTACSGVGCTPASDNPDDPSIHNYVDPDTGEPGSYTYNSGSLARAYEVAYTAAHKGMYVPHKTGGNYDGTYFEATSASDYEGIPANDIRFAIQDIDMLIDGNTICETATAQGEFLKVVDLRDWTTYRITKTLDGRCWFADDLAIDLVTTSAESLKGKTNAADTAINYLKGISTGTSSDQYATSAVNYQGENYSYSAPYIDRTYKETISSDPLDVENEWYRGIGYNFCAASAGSYCYNSGAGQEVPGTAIDAPNDICPAGWRLPTGLDYDSAPDANEFESLVDAYITDRADASQIAEFRRVMRLNFDHSNSSTEWWSSTYLFGSEMAQMIIGRDIIPDDTMNRDQPLYIRCIAK